jgi:hypothetical protein
MKRQYQIIHWRDGDIEEQLPIQIILQTVNDLYNTMKYDEEDTAWKVREIETWIERAKRCGVVIHFKNEKYSLSKKAFL